MSAVAVVIIPDIINIRGDKLGTTFKILGSVSYGLEKGIESSYGMLCVNASVKNVGACALAS